MNIGWVLAPALLLLAIDPASWLLKTWLDEGYGSPGEWIFLLVLGFFFWSWRSPRSSHAHTTGGLKRASILLAGTALMRAAASLLAVHTLGAIALVIDLYALALAAGLAERRRPVSPLWLSVLFALSLPIERLLQRAIGYPLQRVSAAAACAILEPLHDGLTCSGVLIQLQGAALSVDLPCSGAQGLVLFATLVLAAASLGALRGTNLWLAIAAIVPAAVGGNALRLFVLAELARSGVDPSVEPLHSIAGLAALAAGAWPIMRLFQDLPVLQGSVAPSRPVVLPLRRGLSIGALAAAIASAILWVPQKPIDVSAPTEPLWMPATIGSYRGERLPLSDRESAYFAKFGGGAAKVRYQDATTTHTIVAVRTRAPIRHLHGPDECLIGAGHKVRLLGVRAEDGVSVYESIAPDDARYLVEVAYYGDDGSRAVSAAEVIWRWLGAPEVTWTMIERIRPWAQCAVDPAACARFDRAFEHALEINREAFAARQWKENGP